MQEKPVQISVVIPVYQDPAGLAQTVNSLLKQNLPEKDFEIIIVDNGSTDETKKIAQQFQSSFAEVVRFINEDEKQSSYAARNKGIKSARGEIICFVDSDMIVNQDYLAQIAERFKTTTIDYLGCRVNVIGDKDTLTAKYDIFSGFPIKTYLEDHHFACTCCLSLKKNIFDIVGLFDDRLVSGGDHEFGLRVYQFGLKQEYCDDIVINHPARWKYAQIIQKTKRINVGIAQLNYYYPERYQHLVGRYYSARFYCPRNPAKTFKRCRERGIRVSWFGALILSFFHIPLQIIGLVEFLKMRRNLLKISTFEKGFADWQR